MYIHVDEETLKSSFISRSCLSKHTIFCFVGYCLCLCIFSLFLLLLFFYLLFSKTHFAYMGALENFLFIGYFFPAAAASFLACLFKSRDGPVYVVPPIGGRPILICLKYRGCRLGQVPFHFLHRSNLSFSISAYF